MTTVARRVPRIIGVATATPRRRFTQAELLDLAGYRDSRRRGFFEHGDIETRALHLDPARIRAGETIDARPSTTCSSAIARRLSISESAPFVRR